MAKVFTIAPGLENLGAMKTGGQGSVYKGRRIGEIITAIKLLPTPIHLESDNDKNYRDFKNEVEKLKKVNREPNPNVVKIISSGLSETGNFPFIEMDYIEGPDLEDLLKPPYDPIFSIAEVVKVAMHISNALAHCHKNEIKHGDIKSNNIKYNIRAGNYVLLDFGLAAMNEEERRTSLRQAGAIEFMAPEQNEGIVLAQTDVYSFGIILYELLCGSVPFPLQDKSESARNVTRLLHMEAPPPDVIALRQQAMPSSWTAEKKTREMSVPKWLLSLIYKCLEKKPEKRFSNGIELHEYISFSSTHENTTAQGNFLVGNEKQLQLQIQQYKQQLLLKEKQLNELREALELQQQQTISASSYSKSNQNKRGVSRTTFIFLLFAVFALAAFSAYTYINSNRIPIIAQADTTMLPLQPDTMKPVSLASSLPHEAVKIINVPKKNINVDTTIDARENTPVNKVDPYSKSDETLNTVNADNKNKPPIVKPMPAKSTYRVAVEKAYFFNGPQDSTRRKAYMVPTDNASLLPEKEENGFIYVVFTNQFGQTSKGWLKKSDLKLGVE